MPKRSLFLVLIFAVLPALAEKTYAGQLPGAACDLPFVASRFDKESRIEVLTGNLSPANFQVRVGDSSVKVSHMSIDSSAKRIALVLDARSKVDAEEWGLETDLAISLASHGRNGDQFVLFLANARAPEEGFQSPTSMVELLEKLKKSRPIISGKDDMTEVLLAAARKLDPPRFGDTLFLFGRVENSGSATEFDELRTLLLENRIRFYGVSFTDPLKGSVPAGWNPNMPLPSTFRRPELDQLSSETGYPISYHQPEVFRQFKEQLPLLKNYLGLLYEEIAEPYRLSFEVPGNSSPAKLEINLVGSAAEDIRENSIHYQRTVLPCAARQ